MGAIQNLQGLGGQLTGAAAASKGKIKGKRKVWRKSKADITKLRAREAEAKRIRGEELSADEIAALAALQRIPVKGKLGRKASKVAEVAQVKAEPTMLARLPKLTRKVPRIMPTFKRLR